VTPVSTRRRPRSGRAVDPFEQPVAEDAGRRAGGGGADELDRSDGSVDEHLRRIEAQVMAAVAP
jgi:hypothetical protein